jgi:GrpB-like predicted nucleotidyltransferase (UPF0157 family)
MSTVVVAEYDPHWANAFAAIRDYLWPSIHDLTVSIEHVGSTAVPGLAAKPIIDIDIVIAPDQALAAVVTRLEPLGYTHLGTLGIAGRDAFRQHNVLPRHNLYVCPADSLGLRNHLALREYLRANPAAVHAYSERKRQLAAAFPNDITRYVAGKTDLIISLLRAAGLAAEDIAQIEQANQLL